MPPSKFFKQIFTNATIRPIFRSCNRCCSNASSPDTRTTGGAHAAQAAEADADAEQMSDAELTAALPPALLRVMGCADAADEAGRFMAWAAALQLFSQAPPPTQARLS